MNLPRYFRAYNHLKFWWFFFFENFTINNKMYLIILTGSWTEILPLHFKGEATE